MAAEFSFEGVDAPVSGKLTGEIRRTPSEESRELTKVVNRRRQIAAKRRLEFVRPFFRPTEFAGQSQLVVALFNVELLDLDLAVVERRADHHRVRGPIAPGQSAELRPKRGGGMAKIAHPAPNRELARVERTARPVIP